MSNEITHIRHRTREPRLDMCRNHDLLCFRGLFWRHGIAAYFSSAFLFSSIRWALHSNQLQDVPRIRVRSAINYTWDVWFFFLKQTSISSVSKVHSRHFMPNNKIDKLSNCPSGIFIASHLPPIDIPQCESNARSNGIWKNFTWFFCTI